jgi:hypothetical protein
MSESIGNLYSTEIPSLSENADIQEAFRLYHYGAPSGTGVGEYDPTNSNVANLINPSIAYSLNNLQSQITTISGSLGVQATVWTTKGDLVTRTSSPGVTRFGVGADGTILTANSATGTGLEWATPVVTLTNLATLTNKTLTSPAVDGAGIIFEGATADAFETTLTVVDPTVDRTITLPDVTGTVVTTGNLSAITSTGTLSSLSVTGNVVYHTIPESKATTYLLTLTDDGKIIEMSGGGFLQIPTDASVNFPIGTQITVLQTTSSQATIQAVTPGTTTVNGTPGLKLRTQWSSATLIKRGVNLWVAIGDLSA